MSDEKTDLRKAIKYHSQEISKMLIEEIRFEILENQIKNELKNIDERFRALEKAIADSQRFSFGTFALEIGFSFLFSFAGSMITRLAFKANIVKRGREMLPKYGAQMLYVKPDAKVLKFNWKLNAKKWDLEIVDGKKINDNFQNLANSTNKIIDYLKNDNIKTDVIADLMDDVAYGVAGTAANEIVETLREQEFKTTNIQDWSVSLKPLEEFLIDNVTARWKGVRKLSEKTDSLFFLLLLDVITEVIHDSFENKRKSGYNYFAEYKNYVSNLINKYFDFGIFLGMNMGNVVFILNPIPINHPKLIPIKTPLGPIHRKEPRLRSISGPLKMLEQLGWLPKGHVNKLFQEWGNNVVAFLWHFDKTVLKDYNLILKIDCVICKITSRRYVIALRMNYLTVKKGQIYNPENWVDPYVEDLRKRKLPLIKYWIINNYPSNMNSKEAGQPQDIMLRWLKQRTIDLIGYIPTIKLEYPDYYSSQLKASSSIMLESIMSNLRPNNMGEV